MGNDGEEREVRAYFALQGASEDWRRDLVAVLRSDEPISELFREALAKAVEGDLHGFRLELQATGGEKKRRRDHHVGTMRRREWQAVGEWIESRITHGDTRETAVLAASKEYPRSMSEKTCDAALDYSRRVKRWRELQSSDRRQRFGDLLDQLFHTMDAAGTPLDADPP